MASCFDSVQTLFKWLPDISNISGINVSNLVQTSNSSLQYFSNGNSFVDGSSHCFQNNFIDLLFLICEEATGIRDVVSHLALSGDADFILLNLLILRLGLLNSLIFIHGNLFWFWEGNR